MALTPEQIANAIVRDCKKRRLGNFEIRRRRSELIGGWLRSTPWYLRDYPTYEMQSSLYWLIEKQLFRLTTPKKTPAKRNDPRPQEDPRNLKLFK